MQPSIEIDAWDRTLAACLFGLSGSAIWTAFALLAGFYEHGDTFFWQVGSAALASSTFVGAMGAPGLVRRARGGSLARAAGLGIWLMWGSYALGAVLFSLIASIDDPSMAELIPVMILSTFAVATVVLSPGLLVGMMVAALYGAIVRSESWTAPRMVGIQPDLRTLKDDALDLQGSTP